MYFDFHYSVFTVSYAVSFLGSLGMSDSLYVAVWLVTAMQYHFFSN